MIECSLYAGFLAARWTRDACQWLGLCRIDCRPATGTCLGGGLTRHWGVIVTFCPCRAKRDTGFLPVGFAGISPADSQTVIVHSCVRRASPENSRPTFMYL